MNGGMSRGLDKMKDVNGVVAVGQVVSHRAFHPVGPRRGS
jgi:hypothetical protein